jgi:hypothetical protein
MRIIVILIGCLGLGAAFAQETSTNKPPAGVAVDVGSATAPPDSRAVKSISRPAPSVRPGRVAVDGAIPKAARSKSLLQMINPLAPKEYGDGTEVVARHPITGEAQGVTLLMFTCPERPNQPKARKSGAAAAAGGK